MTHQPRISIVSADAAISSTLQLRLQSKGYHVTVISKPSAALGSFYSDPPDLVIADISTPLAGCQELLVTMRSDSFFSPVPIIGIFSVCNEQTCWQDFPLDDFVVTPVDFGELFSRINLCFSRIKRIFDNNPLTRLPGNTSIQKAIEEAMGWPLSVCYVDINNFKPYNDVYGFTHGDEVIRMLSRIMANTVRETGGGFCGHIGGDDFVFIVPIERSEQICQTVINNFDRIVLTLFDEQIREQGFYKAFNRKGEEEHIPLLGVSIAIVNMNTSGISHAAKVAEVAAELKKLAKKSNGSCFVTERRNYSE